MWFSLTPSGVDPLISKTNGLRLKTGNLLVSSAIPAQPEYEDEENQDDECDGKESGG